MQLSEILLVSFVALGLIVGIIAYFQRRAVRWVLLLSVFIASVFAFFTPGILMNAATFGEAVLVVLLVSLANIMLVMLSSILINKKIKRKASAAPAADAVKTHLPTMAKRPVMVSKPEANETAAMPVDPLEREAPEVSIPVARAQDPALDENDLDKETSAWIEEILDPDEFVEAQWPVVAIRHEDDEEVTTVEEYIARATLANLLEDIEEEQLAEDAANEPATRELIAEELTLEEPAAQEPAAEPAAEEFAAVEPIAQEPAAEELAPEPVAQEHAAEELTPEPIAEEPAAEEFAAEEPVAEEPAAQEPAAEEPVAEDAAELLRLLDNAFELKSAGYWNAAIVAFAIVAAKATQPWIKNQAEIERVGTMLQAKRNKEAIDLVFNILEDAEQLAQNEMQALRDILDRLQSA